MKRTILMHHIIGVCALILVNNTAFAQNTSAAEDKKIEHNVRNFLNGLNSGGGKPIESLTPNDARAVLIGAQKSVNVDISGITSIQRLIKENGQTISIHVIKPKDTKAELPAFMFFHGGGWVLGDYQTHERLVRDLVVNSGAAAVFVDYTPSPEAHYPTAINQAYDATNWVATHGNEIGIDGKRLAVVGNSVGGNMATVVALMSKDKSGPKICLQVLLWPVTDANFQTDSYEQFGTERFLTKNMMTWFWDNYLPDSSKRGEKYATPLSASLSELKGVAPALILTAENDVLRDEGEAYARKLSEAGVSVSAVRYNGMIHDWGLLNPLAKVPSTRAAMLQAASELKKVLFDIKKTN